MIYDNCKILHPDGTEMFRCKESKIRWYLDRNLGTIVSGSPLSLRLSFEPKGYGWAGETFYLQERENQCCVCGSKTDLTKHHVVPMVYRKYMKFVKQCNYYDVLPVCIDCHSSYERKADKYKEFLANKYNAPLLGINNKLQDRLHKLARSYLRYGHLMPEDKKVRILQEIGQKIGTENPTNDQIKEFALPDHIRRQKFIPGFRSHAQLVMESITDYQSFVRDWRAHFVETMNPRYLPKSWEIDRDLFGRKQLQVPNKSDTI